MGTEAGPLQARIRLPLDAFELDVDWSPSSASVAIVGPSGAGKSSLLRVLAGLEPAAQGTVRVNGDIWLDTGAGVSVPAWERRVGWVPQEVLLFPHLSVRENLAYTGPDPSDVAKVSELLSLSELLERRPRFLSGGERRGWPWAGLCSRIPGCSFWTSRSPPSTGPYAWRSPRRCATTPKGTALRWSW